MLKDITILDVVAYGTACALFGFLIATLIFHAQLRKIQRKIHKIFEDHESQVRRY